MLHTIKALLATALLATTTVASPVDVNAKVVARAPGAWTDFKNNVVYGTGPGWSDPGTLYGRAIQLPDKSLLATSEVYDNVEPISLPIFRSTDGGATWSNFSRFSDKVNGWGMRYQPFLYVLPADWAGLKAGTLMAAGTSIPKDLSKAYIDVYISTNGGKNWDFASHIAYGSGPESTDNGAKAIWEPFLMLYQGQLICFYSDQRDPAHGQKLVHKTTKDLKNWSDDVVDVAMPYYNGRPGMTTVAYSKKTQKFVMTFENCGAPTGFCLVNYKISESPLTFDKKNWQQLVSKTGDAPWGSPYITWALDPRKNDGSGLYIVNGASDGAVYVNDDNLYQDNWTRIDVGVPAAYTRSLNVISSYGRTKLLIAGGGNFGLFPNNALTVSVMDVPTP